MMTKYENIGGVLTDAHYWDCECDLDYIHHISDVEPCEKCGSDPDDQPNSRVNEIVNAFEEETGSDLDEARCGDCHGYGERGTTCNNCKRGIYSEEIE